MKRLNQVINEIKLFTQKSPNISDNINPEYRRYLAKCSKLFEIDDELLQLSREEKDDYYYDRLKELECKVERITKKI